MKHLLLSLLILLSSCSYSSYQLKTNCKVSNQVLFERLTGTLVNEGLHIKTVTSNYLLAESNKESVGNGQQRVNRWIFTVQNDTVDVKASSTFSEGDFSTTSSFTGGMREDITWYWNVRKELESICGNKVMVIETKK